MKKIFIIWLFSLVTYAQKNPNLQVTLTQWPDNKPAAVSITFDDADYTEFEYAFPLLKKYGFKATFGIVGEWTREDASLSAEPGYFNIKKMGWKQLRILAKNGHELAAHGYRHRKFPSGTKPEMLLEEVTRVKKLIETETGVRVFTYHYPYSFVHQPLKEAVRKAGYLFGRAGENKQIYNDPARFDPYQIFSVAIINDTVPSLDHLKKILENQHGQWLVLMYHRLFPPGSKEMKIMEHHKVFNTYSLYPATFEKHMQLLRQSGYWIAPLTQAGRYALQRRHARLKLKKHCGKYSLRIILDDDKYNFNLPMTVLLQTGASAVTVKKNGETRVYRPVNGKFKINLKPGEKIKLKIKN